MLTMLGQNIFPNQFPKNEFSRIFRTSRFPTCFLSPFVFRRRQFLTHGIGPLVMYFAACSNTSITSRVTGPSSLLSSYPWTDTWPWCIRSKVFLGGPFATRP